MDGDPQIIDLDQAHLEEALDHVETALGNEVAGPLRQMLAAYAFLLQMIEKKNTSIKRLRRLIFGAKTESRGRASSGEEEGGEAVAGSASGEGEGQNAQTQEAAPSEQTAEDKKQAGQGRSTASAKKRKGHGRNGASEYTGADWQSVAHPTLCPRSPCPCCDGGKVYEQREPARLIRLRGQAPIGATVHQLQRLRCHLCGEVFSAEPPPEAGSQKHDTSVAATIAIFRYGYGFPWNRLEQIQAQAGIPLPSSTQWQILENAAVPLVPVHEQLIRQAAQGKLLHNDDTVARVLDLMRARAEGEAFHEEDPRRTGTFTTGIVAHGQEGQKMALFETGTSHAGESLASVLWQREEQRAAPLQMCDGLDRNLPKELATIVANCLAHGRRHFVEQEENFPDEVAYVLEKIAVAYEVDARAKKQRLTPARRLELHQEKSKPVMERLHAWFREQIDEKKVEPNSGLGEAIRYMLQRWEKLTRFLHVAGAPLDNNICERALKRAILHRKNSLFYKTLHGAEIGDRFMSLIYTCMLNGVSAFHYLTELQRHPDEVACNPAAWMPWNYTAALAGRCPSPAPD